MEELTRTSPERINNIPEILRRYRLEKLRAPFFSAFFKYLRSVPNLWDQIAARFEKVKEFQHVANGLENLDDETVISDTRDRVKLLAPFWSAVATIPEARAYLELALNEATRSESDRIKDKLRSGDYFVQELVIGGGVHGAIYNSEFIFHAPQVSRLTTERSSILGGQFRKYGPVLSMNSPNRPLNTDIKGQLDNPNMNTFGTHAPVQLTDISGKFYADNADIGLAAALNQYMSSDNVVNSEVVKVQKNLKPESSKGQFVVHLRDMKTGEEYTIFTNRIISSIGLGAPDYGFPQMDDQTRKICGAGDGRVMRYDEFLAEVGDRSNPFPLQRFVGKKVAILGGGHSGLTVAEYLSGLGPEYRGSTTSLGSPAEIILLGTKFEDDKGLLANEISRYAELAGVVQGANDSSTRRKILSPLRELRAIRLEDNPTQDNKEGRITILCRNKNSPDAEPERIDADIIISTAGFTESYGEVFSDLLGENTSGDIADQFTDVVVSGESPFPIARSLKNCPDIIFSGPAAKMDSSQSDLDIAKLFNRPTSAVGLPSTAEKTRLMAKVLARTEHAAGQVFKQENGKTIPIKLSAPGRQEGPLQPVAFSLPLSPNAKERKFNPEVSYNALLEISLLEHAKKYKVSEPTDLAFTVEIKAGDVIEIKSAERLAAPYEEVLRSLADDELFQSAIFKLLAGKLRTKRQVSLVCRLK